MNPFFPVSYAKIKTEIEDQICLDCSFTWKVLLKKFFAVLLSAGQKVSEVRFSQNMN